jgi:4-amino-4-deoxy-L-arabinose transferase-like glycosyltransferase
VNVSRPWLALVIALFCLPLFIGLGRRDLANDEAIYSFAVDRILETGDWLEPELSPGGHGPFLEKPPLKFWIVAAPIALGLLPHNEFGLRFWDALFGGLALVYVFLIGVRLINPIAGAVAALTLFGHRSLLFDHGLRDNAMEAPLLLSYCAGVYHALVWAAADEVKSQRRHALAAGLYFVLGFMTKFVAALFLPLVLAISLIVSRDGRRRIVRDAPLWAAVSLVVLTLVLSWFIYAHLQYGAVFWNTIVGEHVVRRFTDSLDTGHLQPWYYYALTVYQRLSDSGVAVLAAGGLGLLAWQAAARQRLDARVVLVWAIVPIVVLSFGTSKLYHYAYPFLPAYALATGYLIAMLFALAPAPVERAMSRLDAALENRGRPLVRVVQAWPVRFVLVTVIAASVALAVASLLLGQVRWEYGDAALFRSSGIFRPAMVALLFALPLGISRNARRYVLPLVIISFLPLPAYRASLAALTVEDDQYRSTVACIRRIDEQLPASPRGLYVAWPYLGTLHPVTNYYFRRVKPWERDVSVDPDKVAAYGLGRSVPILIVGSEYRKLSLDLRQALPHPVDLKQDGLLILPGPYASCEHP